jgi:hypothetical protein
MSKQVHTLLLEHIPTTAGSTEYASTLRIWLFPPGFGRPSIPKWPLSLVTSASSAPSAPNPGNLHAIRHVMTVVRRSPSGGCSIDAFLSTLMCPTSMADFDRRKRRRSPSTENVRNRRRRVTEEALAGLEVQPRPRGRPRKHTEEALAGLEVQPRPRGPPRKYAEEAQKCSRNYVGSLGR